MIRKFAISFFSVLALPLSSFSMVGGPFDGGDYGQTLDDQGVYQAIYRMKNGSGFMQFGTNVDLEFDPNTTSTGTSSVSTNKGGVLNRSLIYLQGITYYGIASGAVDHDRGIVTGLTNGQSDLVASTTGGGSSTSVTVVANGTRNFSANSEYDAKITSKAPLLKFKGKGEVTVLASNNSLTLQTIATTLLTNMNAPILAFPPGTPAGTTPPTPAIPPTAAELAAYNAALQANVAAVQPLLNATPQGGTESTGFTISMKVLGQRKFFLSRR